MNIVVDEEFKGLIPSLLPDELAQLEANILKDGCRDPLVVWPADTFRSEVEFDDASVEAVELGFDAAMWRRDDYINDGKPYRVWLDESDQPVFDEDWPRVLVDGHNRLSICIKHGIPYETVDMRFDSRDHAMLWMLGNQEGRRNLSDYNRGALALRKKAVVARMAKERQGTRTDLGANLRENSHEGGRTDERLAESAGISSNTLRKIEKIEAQAPAEVKALAAADEVSIHLASQFVELPQQAQEAALEAISESSAPAKEIIREAVHNHRAQGTGENEWYTPAEYVEAAREVLGEIDLDPASSEIANARVRAKAFYSIEDDGLSKQWSGRVWLNPPYAQPAILQFIERLCESAARGGSSSSPHVRLASQIGADASAGVTEAILLTHNYTDTRWFHVAAEHAAAICFTRGRIGFLSPEGKKAAPTQGQAFFYFGPNHRAFADVFSRFGFVVEVSRGFRNAEQLDVAA